MGNLKRIWVSSEANSSNLNEAEEASEPLHRRNLAVLPQTVATTGFRTSDWWRWNCREEVNAYIINNVRPIVHNTNLKAKPVETIVT